MQLISCNSGRYAALHPSTLFASGDLANRGRKKKNRFFSVQYEC
jgi:hypothetical protein